MVIENIERHLGLGEPLTEAIVRGASEVAIPTVLATRVDLYRVRSGVHVAGNGALPVLAAVAGCVRVAAGEPGAVVYDGAGVVWVFDARARGGRA